MSAAYSLTETETETVPMHATVALVRCWIVSLLLIYSSDKIFLR